MIQHFPGLKLKQLLKLLPKPQTIEIKNKDGILITQLLWDENGKSYGVEIRYRCGLSYNSKQSVSTSDNGYELDIFPSTDNCINGQDKLDILLCNIKNKWTSE